MKKLGISIFLIGIINCCCSLFCEAATIWECEIVNWEKEIENGVYSKINNILIIQWIDNVITTGELNQAILNLATICCNQKSFQAENNTWCKANKPYFLNKDDIPNSVYLFDHIFDVLMRKLDGEPFYKNKKMNNQEIQPDPIGKERYEFIKKQQNDSGATNTEFVEQYQIYRKESEDHKLKAWYLNNPNHKDQISFFETQTGLQWILDNYKGTLEWQNDSKTITLKERYLNVCNIANYLYKKVKDSRSERTDNNIKQYCALRVKQRIEENTAISREIQMKNNGQEAKKKYEEDKSEHKQMQDHLLKTTITINDTLARILKTTQVITPSCT